MIDHRKRQLDKARRERRLLLAEHVTFEQAQTNAKAKHYPNGSYFAWARDEVWGPMNSAVKENKNAA
ncbi:hypothetical protein D9M72_511000 [compost metagenome]